MTEHINETEIEKNKQLINSFGVYELRGLARELGVNAPTTKLREELINEIALTLATGKAREPKQTNKGRPYKRLTHIDEILETIRPAMQQPETIVFNQQSFSDKQWHNKVSGVIRIGQRPYFFDTQSCLPVYLSDDFVKKYSLQSGDFICGTATRQNEEVFLKDILEINFTKKENYKAKQAKRIAKVLPTKYLQSKYGQILVGGRNVVMTSKPLFIKSHEYGILDFVSEQKQVNVILGCNLCFEDKATLSSKKNYIFLTTDYEDEVSNTYQRVLDTSLLVSNLASKGLSVNLVLYNIGGIAAELDKKFHSSTKHASETIKEIKKLMSLAFASDKNSTTIITTCDQRDADDDLVKQDVLKISNMI